MRSLVLLGLALTAAAATAAPQPYLIRGHWIDVRDAYVGAVVDEPFQGLFIYDPEARNITGDPAFEGLGDVDAGQTPTTQQIYAFESRSEPFPGVLPVGPNGWNFLYSGGMYFPRATNNSEGEPHRPPIGKVTNDAAGPFAAPLWDVISFSDNLNLAQTGGGTHGVALYFIDFTSNGQSIASLALPASLDFDVFEPLHPWGITIRNNAGVVAPGGPTNDGIEQIPWGDANLDGRVTGADYTLWADHFGLSNGDAIWVHGDFNVDGQVTGADYTIWADHFGADLIDGSAAAVPEPAALTFGWLAASGPALLCIPRVGRRFSRRILLSSLALFLVGAAVVPAAAAPQAYYFRGFWAQVGLPYLDADLGEAFDGVLIYDPDLAHTLDITNLPGTQVDFPGYQSIYAFRSPTTPDEVQLPIGPNGLNFLRVYREDLDEFGVLPRARTNSDGSPRTSPYVAKITNDVPDPFGGPIGWDVFDTVDHLSAVDLGGGLSRRINFAFIDPSGTSLADRSLPPSLDLADWTPAAPWGIDIDGNVGVIVPSDPNVPGQLRAIPFGDANLDGSVTGADYTIWADNFNRPQQAAWIHGDFNADGQVTGADYTIWADNFGATSAASVPEPASAWLGAAGLLAGGGWRLVRRRVR